MRCFRAVAWSSISSCCACRSMRMLRDARIKSGHDEVENVFAKSSSYAGLIRVSLARFLPGRKMPGSSPGMTIERVAPILMFDRHEMVSIRSPDRPVAPSVFILPCQGGETDAWVNGGCMGHRWFACRGVCRDARLDRRRTDTRIVCRVWDAGRGARGAGLARAAGTGDARRHPNSRAIIFGGPKSPDGRELDTAPGCRVSL